MPVFDKYAQYYDLFYQKKDYPREVEYIDALIKKHGARDAKTILDLGCGTGGHALLLSEKGYHVTGVDRSAAMLAIAEEKKTGINASVEFERGDISTINLNKRFDVAIAMFAVMGYQTANDELERALNNVWKHLKPNGLLIFDAWFGPAVIRQQPQDKVLIVDADDSTIFRYTRPELDILTHTVRVNFSVLQIRGDTVLDRVEETHKMRFFFPKELEFVLAKTGYQLIAMHPFVDIGGEPTEEDWTMVVIARKARVRQ